MAESRIRQFGLRELLCLAVAVCATACSAVASRKDVPATLTLTVRHMQSETFEESHSLSVGDEVLIHDTGHSVKLMDFVPDFCMSMETQEVYSRSPELKNPAVKLELRFDGQTIYSTWVLEKQTTVHRVRAPGYYFLISDVRMGAAPLEDRPQGAMKQ